MVDAWRQWMEDTLAHQGRRLLCWFPFGMALGISAYFSCLCEPSFTFCVGVAIAGLAGAAMSVGAPWYPRWGLTARAGGGAIASLALGFCAVMWEAHHQPLLPDLPQQAVWTQGRVVRVDHLPPRDEGGERFRLLLENAQFDSPWYDGQPPLTRMVRIMLRRGERIVPQAGDEIRIRALFHPPSVPVWPYGRDFQREAWFSGLAGSGSALSSPQYIAHSTQYWITRWRDQITARIMTVLPDQDGAVIAAVLSGETGALSPDTRREFAASGLAHLLAVAGLHLGLVIGLCFTVVRAMLIRSEYAALFWPCREIALWAALGIGAMYVVLTGCHIPGLRALGMAVYGAVAFQLGRKVVSLRALALVAIALETWHPFLVLDVSFQMSMAAVMALIAGYEALRGPLARLRERSWLWARYGVPFCMLAITSLLAGTATLPVSMAHFGAFQPWFVVANMVAVPLMAMWVMPLGIVSLLLRPFGWDGPSLHMMGWGVRCVRFFACEIAHMPGASAAVLSCPGWGLFLMMVGLFVLCVWRGRMRWSGVIACGVGIASIWFVPRPVMLMAPDGQTLAVHLKQGWVSDSAVNAPFLRETWKRDLGVSVQGTLPLSCQNGLCRFSVAGYGVLLDRRARSEGRLPSEQGDMCQDIVLVVSRSDGQGLCPGLPVLDRDMVYKNGAWAVYRHPQGLRFVSDRSARGERPWVLRPGAEGIPMLPFAKAE